MFIFQVTLNPPPRQTKSRVVVNPTPGPIIPPSGRNNFPNKTQPRGLAKIIRTDTLSGQFATLVLISVILAVIGLLVSYLVLVSVENSYKDIVDNSAPSIVAAENLGQSIQNADAAAANYQLYARVDVSSPDFDPKVYGDTSQQATCTIGLKVCAYNDFVKARNQVDNALYAARKNITYPGEANAINAIADRFLDYTGRIEVMKHELDLGHREAALAAYKAAKDILVGNIGKLQLDAEGHAPEEQMQLSGWNNFDTTKQYLGIEANIEKLFKINKAQLDKTYSDTLSRLTLITAAVIVFAVLLVLSLAFLTVRYAVITHRIINPGYALALLGAIVLAIVLTTTLLKAKSDYQTVGNDSFTTIQAVSIARQVAADADADEARLLLSPEGPGLDSTNPILTEDVRQAFAKKTLTDDFNAKQTIITNMLKVAWQNITPDAKTTLCQATQNLAPTNTAAGGQCTNTDFALSDYLQVDKQIRADFDNNLLAAAIQLNTNNDPGKSNETFNRFDSALVGITNLNEKKFDASSCGAIGVQQFGNSCNGNGYISTLAIGVLVLFPLIALATVGGYFFARRLF